LTSERRSGDASTTRVSTEPQDGGPEALFTRRFWIACAMHFSGGMAAASYILFPLFIRHLGGNELHIGLYAGATGAAAVLARLPVGRCLDVYGRRPVLALGSALQGAAWIGFALVSEIGVASTLLVLLFGVASGSLFATYFTYATDIVPVSRRSEGIAMFGIWGMLPNGLAPWLGEVLIKWGGYSTYALVAALFAFVSLWISRQLPETHEREGEALQPQRPISEAFPWHRLRLSLGTTFAFGLTVNSLFTFLAPFAHTRGLGSVGHFFLAYATTAVAVRVLTGRLPDRFGLRPVLIPALLMCAAGVGLVPLTRQPLAFAAIGALCGAGHGYAFPILNVLTVQQVSTAHRGRAVSWFTAMFDLGNSLANPLLGTVAYWAGYRAMFASSAAALLVATVIAWRKLPRA
jgi:predicted MFS family arabinose efflux permease